MNGGFWLRSLSELEIFVISFFLSVYGFLTSGTRRTASTIPVETFTPPLFQGSPCFPKTALIFGIVRAHSPACW